jgi:hypothetical protein
MAKILDERLIVGCDQYGDAHLLEIKKQLHDFCREIGIKITGGFIGQ